MASALSFSDAAALRAALAENDEGPLVVIELRPPCASERIEISGGFDGSRPYSRYSGTPERPCACSSRVMASSRRVQSPTR